MHFNLQLVESISSSFHFFWQYINIYDYYIYIIKLLLSKFYNSLIIYIVHLYCEYLYFFKTQTLLINLLLVRILFLNITNNKFFSNNLHLKKYINIHPI